MESGYQEHSYNLIMPIGKSFPGTTFFLYIITYRYKESDYGEITLMLNLSFAGTWRDTMWPDKWTAVTEDGKMSAQFEHTLLVTETGCDVLTARPNKDGQPWFMDSM